MKSLPAVQSIQPFHVAIGVWGDLKKHKGIHWNCGDGAEAKAVGWKCYDKYQHPAIPNLNSNFKRLIFTDQENQFFYSERLTYLKACRHFMSTISQAIVVVSLQFENTDSIVKLCYDAGFQDVKRIQDGCLLVHKY